MKKLLISVATGLFVLIVTGCAASSTSPVGVNCDYTKGKLLWEMPLDCQPGN